MTARAWRPEGHAAAVDRLADAGWQVVVTGGAGELELTSLVAGNRALNLGGRLDLVGLAEVISGARAVVVGNTGPAHLAAAVGTPVVSLYAPTVPASRWRPWMVPHVLLGNQSIACAGCRARTCPVPGHPCLSGIHPDTVVRSVEKLVSVPGLAHRPSSDRWHLSHHPLNRRPSESPRPPAGSPRPSSGDGLTRRPS